MSVNYNDAVSALLMLSERETGTTEHLITFADTQKQQKLNILCHQLRLVLTRMLARRAGLMPALQNRKLEAAALMAKLSRQIALTDQERRKLMWWREDKGFVEFTACFATLTLEELSSAITLAAKTILRHADSSEETA